MMSVQRRVTTTWIIGCLVTLCGAATGADRWGLDAVGPELKSVGPMAMGPDGILLVADPKQAAVMAIQTEEKGIKWIDRYEIDDVTGRIATTLKTDRKNVSIEDLVYSPTQGTAYLAVQVRDGDSRTGQIWSANPRGVNPVDLSKLRYAMLAMPNPPEDKTTGEGRRQRNLRDESITGLTYADGRILVSGLSATDKPSSVWEFQFPFSGSDSASSVEIYHAAHGRYEDSSAIRTFVTMNIGGQPTLLAGYTCTPLVKLPLSAIEPGANVRGTTVAELGNWNKPLDMVVYDRDGKTYVMMSNSARGMMRISTEGIESNEGLTEPVKDGAAAGQNFETIEAMNKVTKMDRFGTNNIIALVQREDAGFNLTTFDLP
jgi:hypothetical protein